MNLARRDGAKEEWTCRYEGLRKGAAEGYAFLQNSWGLTLFIRQGLVAWMHAWPREHTAHKNGYADRLVSSTVDFAGPTPSLGAQITFLLADIILNRPREIMT